MRQIWKFYKKNKDWKNIIKELGNFIGKKCMLKKTEIEPFDPSKLKLITMDFIS